MNKKSAIIKIVVYSILIMALLGILVSGINGNAFNCVGCSIGGYHFDNEDKYSVGEFTLDEEITAIDIDWVAGSVKVVVTDEANVSAEESEVDDEDEELRYRVVDGKLMIKFKKSERFSFGGSESKDLTLYIPKEMAEKMSYMNISCVSASYDMADINADEFIIEMVSGNINIKNAVIEKVDVQSVSGSTKIEGSIDELNAESVSGKIDITSDKQLRLIDVESVSGKVSVNMPEGDGFTAEMESISGDMDIEFSVTTKDDKSVNGDGSAEYSFETVSGDIELNKID